MLYCSYQIIQSLLFACLTFFIVSSVVNAEGRVFVLDPRNLRGFREAEQACASQNARLASVEELRQAVVECFFSHCTRGWLYGGMVGTTVCNADGSSLKAVSVKTENATEDTAHLSAYCMKNKAVICGDPPSFPNARLQDHSGFEIGDELLYTCTPGYVMPSGHTAFSLLCDSCGEWYGTVQICVKDAAETHVDYEDKFKDSYEEADHDHDSQDEVFEDASRDGKRILQQQETRFWLNVEENHQDRHKEHDIRVKVMNNSRTFEGTVDEVAKREEDAFTVHPRFDQDRTKLVRTGAAAATEEPVSVLSQKHMFWFPSEAFQEEVPPIASDSVTQATQRASGARSEESKETESQERIESIDVDDDDDHHHHDDDDLDRNNHRDDERDIFDDPGDDRDDNDDHDDSHHDDLDIHEDDRTDDHDDPDSRQEEDFDDNVKQPAQYEDLDRRDRNKDDDDDHDDHYDMGEHEGGSDRTQEYNDRDDAHDGHPSKEDHDDDHRDDDGEHLDNSEEPPESDDHDDGEEHYDHDEDDIHNDHEDKDEESYDDHDSHEDDDDHPHIIISVANERRPNITQSEAGTKTSKDNAWLDGYPVDLFDTENGDSTKGQMRTSVVKTTDKPNDVEVRKRVPHISLSDEDISPTMAPKSDQGREKKGWPSFRTPATSSDHSNSPSYSDTLDYDTQQVAPTHSWLDDLTNHPFFDHGPAPPVHDGNIFPGVMEEHTVDNLPGEMGEIEGEKRKTICAGGDCPPHPPTSTTQGAKVAAIIVAVCAMATAVIIGVWCYRRKQQKSSLYEMNGKGQSQSGQGQQIEMQQKV